MVGERIRQARLARGLTLQAVAEKMTEKGQPITKAGLSKYERSKSQPNQSFLVVLGSTLGVGASYFFEEQKPAIRWIAFRKLSKMALTQQERVKAYAEHVVESQLWLQKTLYPNEKANFPSPEAAESLADAERAAANLRRLWQLNDQPIDSLTSTVEDNGGVVVPCADIASDFDGLAGRATESIPVAVVSMQVPDDRRRYNLAHELGHLVMDCRGVTPKDEEKLANRFASALLVPPSAATRELGEKRRQLEVRELGLLKCKYGLSMQGWIRRAFDLEIIEQGHYKNLCILFSARHWKKREPIQFTGQETPTRLKQMTLRALAENIISADRAEQICPGSTAAMDKMNTRASFSPSQLRKMPREQRDEILRAAASLAEQDYLKDRSLTDFEAFLEEDLYDSHGEAEPDQG